jgi:hypothetical protein
MNDWALRLQQSRPGNPYRHHLDQNRRAIMKGIAIPCLALLTLSATAEEQQRVYQTGAYGRIRYNQPSYSANPTLISWKSDLSRVCKKS